MRKIAIIMMLLIVSVTATACTGKSEEPEPTTGSPQNSIVTYVPDDEGCQKLIADMKAGKIPQSCELLYDQMGSRPAVTVTDSKEVAEIYNLFTQMTVVGSTNESITDCYHHVYFKLQDGTEVRFNFEGDIWCYSEDVRYQVQNSGKLWNKAKQLQDQEL